MHRSQPLLGRCCVLAGLLVATACRPGDPSAPSTELEDWAWSAILSASGERPLASDDERCTSPAVAEVSSRLGRLVAAPAPGGRVLAWGEIEQFADGSTGGPVALVEVHAKTVNVRALGWLRGLGKDVGMELVGDWLVVRDASSIQLLRRHRRELHELSLEEHGIGCVTPARFALREHERLAKGDYVWREVELERSLRFVEGMPVIHEHLTVRDIDPRFAAAEPNRLVREVELDRALVLDRWVVRASPGLWIEANEAVTEIELEEPNFRTR